jgi:predicted dehydrogenase/nucleoside-diphosphate-sugar epimerase
MGPRVNLAVVGCGAIAELAHLPAAALLAQRGDLRLTALVDRDRARAEALADRWDVPQVATDWAELSPFPDAVVVALPHHLHAAASLALLRRGAHVLVEKPMALSVADCDAMNRAAADAGAVLAVGLVRRFLPVTRLVKSVLESGALGPLSSFELSEGRVYDWPVTTDSLLRRQSAGGGVLVDAGVHLLDALLYWLGDCEVTSCADDARGGVEAEAEIELATAAGARGTVELSRLRELRNLVRIKGSEATLEASFFTGEVTLRRGSITEPIDRGAHRPCLVGAAEGMDLFRAQLCDWLDAIRVGRPPAVPGAEGRRSVALIEACGSRRRPLARSRMLCPSAAAPGSAERLLSVKPVLVTGGTGFIGGRLAEKLVLEQGARVRVVVRDLARACRLARLDVEIVPGDVTDAAAVERATAGCAVVFHCAYGNRGGEEEQRATNVAGTEAVVRAARRAGVERLVHVSTIAVYGPTADGDLDESSPRQPPADLYAATKAEAEDLVLAAHRRHGLPAAVVQPAVVYGPFGLAWTRHPLTELAAGRLALPNGGAGLCNPVYVDDVADALLLAATVAEAPGEVFLIAGEEPVTWKAFYAAYERMLGVAARDDGGVAAGPMADFFAARTRVRVDKARRLLGYRPRFDLERGMALVEEWARWAGLLARTRAEDGK